MTNRTQCHQLHIDNTLYQFLQNEVLPHSGLDSDAFWEGFSQLVHDLAPKNRELLAKRDALQEQLDTWHKANPGPIQDMAAYKDFLSEIGYLLPQPEHVRVQTQNVDSAITSQAGPQLVVPITNARYALNAANARWGSLYDALYGTDAIPHADGAEPTGSYNPVRGEKVIAFARDFLDQSVPLQQGSHKNATAYAIVDGALRITLDDGSTTTLQQPDALLGYRGDTNQPEAIVFIHNGLHFEIQIDRSHPIGKDDAAG
ncbi:MAG: malate synthase G, partial [Alcaligenaceae bacterium]|nr:malate synthase G [Alcaligenaceae bacterium]